MACNIWGIEEVNPFDGVVIKQVLSSFVIEQVTVDYAVETSCEYLASPEYFATQDDEYFTTGDGEYFTV